MTNYTKTTDFAAKDSLPSGDSGKIIRGSEFETEFDNIATAVNSKSDANNPTFTGTVTIDGLTVNGNTVLGNAATDTVTVTADIASNLIPSADDTYNLGAVGAEWNDLFIDGVANIDSLVANTADINGGTIDGVTIGGSSAGAITGTTITGTSFVTSGNMTFGDNDKALFGAGSDLEIYHNGNHSFITDTGTGSLYIRASDDLRIQTATNEEMLKAEANGAVTAYYDNSAKLATTSTGIDVTGTVTADGLTVDVNSGDAKFIDTGTSASDTPQILIGNGDTSARSGLIRNYNDATNFEIIASASTTSDKNLVFRTVDNASESRLKISNNGDISFYEDTGTTAKFRWDASAESLGLGTTSPANQLDIVSSTNATARIEGGSNGDASLKLTESGISGFELKYDGGDNKFYVGGGTSGSFTTHMTINRDGGNVGIGTSSPATTLTVEGSSANGIELNRNGADAASSARLFFDSSTNCSSIFNSGGNLVFATGATPGSASGTERMRISSGGHVLVGKTAQDQTNTVGVEFKDDGLIVATTDGSQALTLNRKTTDGDIVQFRKDNATVGSIGTSSGDIYLGTGVVGVKFEDGSNAVTPHRADTNVARDGATSLGTSSARFKDLYLYDGVYLGGTAAANKLDDYEEGTFTPTVKGSTTEGTGTYSSIGGTYTKVGDRVIVSFNINMTAHTGAGNILIDLPFSANSSAVGEIMDQNFSYGGSGSKLVCFAQGTASLNLYAVGDNVPWTLQTLAHDSAFTIFGCIAYRTAA